MKVGMYYSNADVRVEEMPVPKIGPGELLVKVIASGICGSDVMEWYRLKKAPRVLGHEIAGDIVKVAKDVDKYKVGDRVFVSHHVPCYTCHYCHNGHHSVCETLRTTNFEPGGFAEFVRIPPINVDRGVFVLPEEITYEEGVFIEPLACVVRGQKAARMRPGLSVAVLGSGMSGLLHVQLAHTHGASRVIATDINPWRLKMATKMGADETIDAKEDVPGRVRDVNDGRGADLVIVATGAPQAVEQALNSVDRGGTILFFAPTAPGVITPVSINEIWKNEVTVTTSYAGSPEDIKVAIQLLRSRSVQVRDMVSHRLPLAEIQKGFELAAQAGNSLKIIIEPHRK